MDKARRKQQQQQPPATSKQQLPAIGDEDEDEEGEEEEVVKQKDEQKHKQVATGKKSSMMAVKAAAGASGASSKKRASTSTSATGGGGHKPGYFGIKSYLHKFYENATTCSDLEDFEEEDSCSHQELKSQQSVSCCRRRLLLLSLSVGFLALLAGLGLLLVGFAFPRASIDLGYQEEMRIIDRRAVAFNGHLEQLKLLGLVVFALGGAVVAAALLLPSLVGSGGGGSGGGGNSRQRGSSATSAEDGFSGEEHFKVRVVHEDSAGGFRTSRKCTNKGAEEEEDEDEDDDAEEEEDATRRLIPVNEQLRAVQPKAEPGGHIVATKGAGLKQIN